MNNTGDTRIIGLLLAGGQGTRMGGRDKGWVEYRGRPMAQWVFEALALTCSPVLISANRSLDRYEALAPGLVFEDFPENQGQGPLAGLLRGLVAAETLGATAVMVSPCDTPDITPALFRTLVEAWQSRPCRPILAESEGRIHPLHGVYPVALAETLAETLRTGERRVMGFARSVGAEGVSLPGSEALFHNRNRPEDMS